MHLLVIGASGYIGKEIYNEAIRKNIDVIGTRCQCENSELYEMDITKSEYVIPQFKGFKKYAIICSADSNIDYAYTNKEKAYHKNVVSTIKLIENLRKFDYKVIFLSSDNVFDGIKGNYVEEDLQNPINEYGKMKAEIEHYILDSNKEDYIMRIGKTIGVFSHQKDMLLDWYQKAVEGNKIYCIKDNIFTPIYVNDVAKSFFALLNLNLGGLYNIVSDVAYSRFELCKFFLKTIDIGTEIYEKEVSEFNFKDKRPLNIALINTKIKHDTNIKFTSMEEVFEIFLKEIM